MVVKIYAALWMLLTVFTAGLLFAGMLTGATVVFVGMFVFGLIYFGMVMVLPYELCHGNETASALERTTQPVIEAPPKRSTWIAVDPAAQQLRYR